MKWNATKKLNWSLNLKGFTDHFSKQCDEIFIMKDEDKLDMAEWKDLIQFSLSSDILYVRILLQTRKFNLSQHWLLLDRKEML